MATTAPPTHAAPAIGASGVAAWAWPWAWTQTAIETWLGLYAGCARVAFDTWAASAWACDEAALAMLDAPALAVARRLRTAGVEAPLLNDA